MYSWDVADDSGVWVAVEQAIGGRFRTRDSCIAVCRALNMAAGILNDDGSFKKHLTDQDYETFAQVHMTHPLCTCRFKDRH